MKPTGCFLTVRGLKFQTKSGMSDNPACIHTLNVNFFFFFVSTLRQHKHFLSPSPLKFPTNAQQRSNVNFPCPELPANPTGKKKKLTALPSAPKGAQTCLFTICTIVTLFGRTGARSAHAPTHHSAVCARIPACCSWFPEIVHKQWRLEKAVTNLIINPD